MLKDFFFSLLLAAAILTLAFYAAYVASPPRVILIPVPAPKGEETSDVPVFVKPVPGELCWI